MINAKEARKMSDKTNEKLNLAARKWIENELEFIENHILEAVEKGQYRTTYFWGANIFKEAKIKEEDARESLKQALYEAGYNYTVRVEKRSDTARLVAEINWEEVEDDE